MNYSDLWFEDDIESNQQLGPLFDGHQGQGPNENPFSIPLSSQQNSECFFSDIKAKDSDDIFGEYPEEESKFYQKEQIQHSKQSSEDILLEEIQLQTKTRSTRVKSQKAQIRNHPSLKQALEQKVDKALTSTKKPRKKEFEAESITHDLQQSSNDSEFEQEPRKTKGKGLKTLSLTVYEIVSALMHTSFKQVADILIKKLVTDKYTSHPKFKKIPLNVIQKSEHNVKRRAYDALNVLIATGLCSKKGKVVSSVIPCREGPLLDEFDSEVVSKGQNLENEKELLQREMEGKRKIVEEKKRKLQELKKCRESYQNLTERNIYREKQSGEKPKQTIRIPFLCGLYKGEYNEFKREFIEKQGIVKEFIYIKSDEKPIIVGDFNVLNALDSELKQKTPSTKAVEYYEKLQKKEPKDIKRESNIDGPKLVNGYIPLEEFKQLLERSDLNIIKKGFIEEDIIRKNIEKYFKKTQLKQAKEERETQVILKTNKKITDYFTVSKTQSAQQPLKPNNCRHVNDDEKEEEATQSRYHQPSEQLSYVSAASDISVGSNANNFSAQRGARGSGLHQSGKAKLQYKLEDEETNTATRVKKLTVQNGSNKKTAASNDEGYGRWYVIDKKK